MLMPLGFGLMLATRRVVWPSLLVVLLPVAIELTQVLIPGRECSVSDWLANSLGGLIGVGVGWLTQRWLRAVRPGAPPTPQPDALTNS
jgi:VanZ family protein